MTRPQATPRPPREATPALTWLLLLTGVLAIAWWQAPAFAQSSDPAQPTPPATSEEEAEAAKTPAVGEEIVVTARKREENLQEIPVAVTVSTGDQLEQSAAADISELQADVPNLSIYSGRNQSTTLTAFMRGIGQADPLWGVDPGVGLYFDDVYLARPQGALLDVFDVQRIETLRGPQGTLYGKNTIGGAIRYVSKPLTDQLAGRISFTGGDYANQDVVAIVGGAIVPGKLRAKLSLASLQHDGWGTNLNTGKDVNDKNTQAGRVALEWLPSDTVNVQLSYDKSKDKSNPKGWARLAANRFCPVYLGGATCPPLDSVYDVQAGLAPLNGTDSEGGAMTIAWDMSSAWRFKSITAYRESNTENNIDFDTTPAPITDVTAIYWDRQTSQEFQLLYDNHGRWNGVLGFYYFDGKAGGLVKNNFLNLLFGTTDGWTKTSSYALFGEGNYSINDRLTLNVGLRATQEKKNTLAYNAGYADATFSRVTAVTADFNKSKTFDSLAPKLALQYQFDPDVMGYVSVSRGFKSGGFNVRAQATVFPQSAEPFNDEILDVAEVGLKTVLGRQLTLNSAVFYGKYKDIQVSTFTAYDSNGDGVEDAFFGNFLNAGDATMKGVEVEYDWHSLAADWFGISGNVSYLDAKPDQFLDANHDGFVDTQVITNAPKYTGSLRLNFDFPAWGGLISASAGVAHRDESTLTNEGGQYPGRPGVPLLPIVQPSFELYDAWINWLSPNAHWRFGITGKNLTNEEYLTNGYNIPALGILTGSYGAPRTVLGTVEYRF